MASRMDEIELKKVEKRRKEKKRVENLGIAYQHLELKLRHRSACSGRRKRPSRLTLLEKALAYIRTLKQKLAAETRESSDGDSTFRISQIPTNATIEYNSMTRSVTTAAAVVGHSSSSSMESSQYTSSESSSENTPTGLMPAYGASDAHPSHLEQEPSTHMLSPWLPTSNNYTEIEYCPENILPTVSNATMGMCNSSYIYCMCCEDQYHWSNGYYDYPNYTTYSV